MLSACVIMACGKPSSSGVNGNTPESKPECLKTAETLWESTTPLVLDNTRRGLLNQIQGYADKCSNTAFKNLLASDANKYALTVKYDEILSCYDAAFERILTALKGQKPAKGEVRIWLLYNMGYVIQTSSSSFGIDIYHYRAAELAPYLDWAGFTHIHQDHKSDALMELMYNSQKPVLSNFYEPEKNYGYHSTSKKDYTLGNCSVHTFITKHNNGSSNVPVTVFQITCADESGKFTLMHSGDSNFIAEEYDVTEQVNVYIPRYAPNALTENQVIGSVFNPDYVLLSHILELSHKDISESRWSYELAWDRASKLNCDQTCVPFWGEKLVWRNNKLNKD